MYIETTHIVKSGETLSGIAKQYGFSNINPIWIFNTKITKSLKVLGPDALPVGAKLYIPHKAGKYDSMIAVLEDLIVQNQKDRQELLNDLSQDKNEADQVGNRVDFAADVLLIGAGAARTSVRLGSKVYKNLVYKKEGLKVLNRTAQFIAEETLGQDKNDVAKATFDSLGDAVVDHSLISMAHNEFETRSMGKTFGKKLAGKAVSALCQKVAKETLSEQIADNGAEIIGTLCDMIWKVGGVAQSGMVKATKALEAIKPSVIAKLVIRITEGEHPDTTHRKAIENINRTFSNSIAKLRARIEDLKMHKSLLYGS